MLVKPILGFKGYDLKNDILYPKFEKKIHDTEKIQYNYSESKRVPFRIEFYQPYKDPYECFNEGDIVYELFQDKNITCTKNDIVDPKFKVGFLDTIDNLKNFMERLVKVDQFSDQMPLYNNSNWLYFVPRNYTKDHLFILIGNRACMEGQAAYAGPVWVDDNNERPTQGFINICPSTFINDSPDNEYSLEMFRVLFHELVHIMGFIDVLFESWLNRETGKRWGSAFPITQYIDKKFPNKTFSILHTPQSHAYASKRWNTKEFAPGIPMGIEIEDGGGPGTMGSHPDTKIANSEVMSGIASTRMIISDLVLSLIEDMGWYSVDFSLAQPLKWGDYASIGMTPPPNVFREPPQLVFPQHYFCNKGDNEVCSYDFKSRGYCFTQSIDCPGTEDYQIMYCSEQGYYNPHNLNYTGSSFWDYMPILVEERISNKNNNICFKAMSTNPNISKTLMKPVICNKEKTSYTVSIFGNSYLCDYDGREYNLTGEYTSFKCSPPRIICEGIEYDKRTFSQPIRVPFPNDKVDENNSSTKDAKPSITKWIVIGVFVALIVSSLVFVLLKKGTNDESSNNFNQY